MKIVNKNNSIIESKLLKTNFQNILNKFKKKSQKTKLWKNS